MKTVSENKVSVVKITNIKWKAGTGVGLPSSATWTVSVPAGTDEDKMHDMIVNKLEDKYGYSVKDFDHQF